MLSTKNSSRNVTSDLLVQIVLKLFLEINIISLLLHIINYQILIHKYCVIHTIYTHYIQLFDFDVYFHNFFDSIGFHKGCGHIGQLYIELSCSSCLLPCLGPKQHMPNVLSRQNFSNSNDSMYRVVQNAFRNISENHGHRENAYRISVYSFHGK